MVDSTLFSVFTEGGFSPIILTDKINCFVQSSEIKQGIANIFLQHTSGSLFIMEFEAGIFVDIENVLEEQIPHNGIYMHHKRNVDTNGSAHVRSALFGCSLTIPVINSKLALGEFQDIVLIDMQEKPKEFNILCQIIGE